MTPGAYPVSAVIMTYNEAANIARCIASVRDVADEVFVLDSFSTDNTVEIARELGARVEQHAFQSYASQRRVLVSMATHDHILMLDADECLSAELKASIIAATKALDHDVYTSNRRSHIGNKALKHGSWYPDRNVRLFDRRKASVAGMDVHETVEPQPDARISHLGGDLLHYADEDIHARFEKVNLYTTLGAKELYAKGKRGAMWRVLVKPGVRFFSSYVLKLGFLDGYYGFVVARSESHYVFLRETKLIELAKQKKL